MTGQLQAMHFAIAVAFVLQQLLVALSCSAVLTGLGILC